MTVLELRKMTGLSQAGFAALYDIPKRTIESWEEDKRNPPGYVTKLLERAVREDVKSGAVLPMQSIDKQVEEASREDLTEDEIIGNRFL